MALLKTYENWVRGEFVFEETYVQESDANGPVESVKKDKVAFAELSKIEKAQIEIGLKQKKERLEKAKNEFLARLKNAISTQDLFFLELKSIENILQGNVPKQYVVHVSDTFGLTLTRSQLDGISQFYYESIENENIENYRFIASPLVFPFTNEAAPQGLAYFLHDLYKWMIELKEGKLARLAKFEKHKHFSIIVSFAKGEVYKWRKEGLDYDDIAERLNAFDKRPYISETFNAKLSSGKSLYNRPYLISRTKEYCELVGIDLCQEFVDECEKVSLQKAKRKPLQ